MARKSELKKERYTIILTVAVITILVIVLFFNSENKPETNGGGLITGFVNVEDLVLHKLNPNILIEQSSSYDLDLLNENNLLSSLSLSGTITGSGTVSVYLYDGVEQKLVFTNIKKIGLGYKDISSNVITGMAIKEVTDDSLSLSQSQNIPGYDSLQSDYSTIDGDFKQVCVETCKLIRSFDSAHAELIVKVQPGTNFLLEEITYTLFD